MLTSNGWVRRLASLSAKNRVDVAQAFSGGMQGPSRAHPAVGFVQKNTVSNSVTGQAGLVFELARYGGPVVTALARLEGHPVGIIASDPYVGGGVLNVEGSDAMIRLVDLCQTFHLPVVVMTDQPGIAVGTQAEKRGTIRYAARAVAAVYQAGVPTAEIIIRKCFGVGGACMTNRHAYVQRYTWPSGEWGSLRSKAGWRQPTGANWKRAKTGKGCWRTSAAG